MPITNRPNCSLICHQSVFGQVLSSPGLPIPNPYPLVSFHPSPNYLQALSRKPPPSKAPLVSAIPSPDAIYGSSWKPPMLPSRGSPDCSWLTGAFYSNRGSPDGWRAVSVRALQRPGPVTLPAIPSDGRTTELAPLPPQPSGISRRFPSFARRQLFAHSFDYQ